MNEDKFDKKKERRDKVIVGVVAAVVGWTAVTLICRKKTVDWKVCRVTAEQLQTMLDKPNLVTVFDKPGVIIGQFNP